MTGPDFTTKPTGWFKRFLHLPTYLFRARLGFLLGKRFLMIEHRGRRSGTLYRTVVEVAGRRPERHEWVVTSGTGPRADWYLNLRANGVEAVWLGSHRHAATVRFLSAEEAAPIMRAYERAHPKAAATLMDKMGVSYDGSDADRVRMMEHIPMVAFRVGG